MVYKGYAVELICESYNTFWSFNNTIIPQNTYVKKQSKLIINQFDDKHIGYYECKGVSSDGTFFAGTTLKMVG